MRGTQARVIQKRFIGVKSSTPINISGVITGSIIEKYMITFQENIQNQIQEGQHEKVLFDSAYTQIFDILKYDSFPRFLRWLEQHPNI